MPPSTDQYFCVHVIEDDEAVRQTVVFLLSSAGFSTRAYASATAFLKDMPRAPPGCILTDVRLPGMSGLDLVKEVAKTPDRFSAVVMSGYGDIPLAVEAMKAGAADFLQKPFGKAALVGAVESAFAKLREASAAPVEDGHACRALFNALSPRQMDVLKGMLEGKLNKTIAHELGLSVRTVESYRGEIFAKTQVNGLSELVRKATLAGL